MSESRQPPRPTELVYVPSPSWLPALTATGLSGVVIGLFAGWPYAVAAAILGLASLRAWVRRTGDEIARLPLKQRLTSAVLPAVPLHRSDDDA
jgi:uncharacterized membrane protein YdjX (TVP38/TMEM64 family)